MQVQNIGDSSPKESKSVAKLTSDNKQFSKLLSKQTVDSQKVVTDIKNKFLDTISLGKLSKQNNNVAQLLLSHPELKSKTWSIVHNDLNKNKPYQQIRPGTEIFYNKQTQELQWEQSAHVNMQPLHNNIAIKKAPFETTAVVNTNSEIRTKEPTRTAPLTPNTDRIELGQVNQANPTVSNLLSNHSEFKTDRWNIIHSDINKDKAFTKIPDGSTVYIDKKTRELSWTTPEQRTPTSINQPELLASDTTKILSKKLDDAVKPLMGTPYNEIDCYTLVVHGLKNMGVRYKGQDSLSRQLLNMAEAEGRASNAYFTGEGITQAMGEKIYTKAITRVEDIAEQSKAIFQEMKHLMQKGDILSFSLETKGHTGVISQNQDEWTYINSGRLDNSIVKDAPKHGVGEETLLNEISNWIKLAQKRKESLQITVGRLDNQKFV